MLTPQNDKFTFAQWWAMYAPYQDELLREPADHYEELLDGKQTCIYFHFDNMVEFLINYDPEVFAAYVYDDKSERAQQQHRIVAEIEQTIGLYLGILAGEVYEFTAALPVIGDMLFQDDALFEHDDPQVDSILIEGYFTVTDRQFYKRGKNLVIHYHVKALV